MQFATFYYKGASVQALIKVFVLAVIQGIAEFLPVSSSGHLVLAKTFMGLETGGSPLLEIVLHAGTLVSILVFYFTRLSSLVVDAFKGKVEAWKYASIIVLSCIPAMVLYALAGDALEEKFNAPVFAASMLCVTGLILLSVKKLAHNDRDVTWWRAIVIGVVQAFAMLPGISRSGSTISISRVLGICPKKAAEFSFLMSVPLLAGAVLMHIKEVFSGEVAGDVGSLDMGVGFVVSAVVGYFSIKWLVKLLGEGKFWRFGIYCLVAGAGSLVALLF
jgi:undecaprenyl-diphosphatase